jgi:hypothetical protein
MDTSELRDQLISLLRWDAVVADGVTAGITQASSRDEIDAIMNDYIPASETQARKAVANYAAAKFPPKRSNQATTTAAAVLPVVSDEDLKASVFMGVNVKTKVKKRNNVHASEAGDNAAPVLAKKIVNCLKCGKIFDCRQPNGEAMRFLSAGGRCTYCENRVRLTYTDGSTNEYFAEEEETEAEKEISENKNSQSLEKAEALKEAEALRDRLVQFDRQSAKTTTVIDDQSDYFAIDSNAWLSDEERTELKRRQAEAEAAAEAAKKRMTVTVDLLGRRVVMDGSDEHKDLQTSSNTAAAVEAAMAATAAEKPQGGGSAAVGFRDIDSSTRMVPSGGTNKYIFVRGDTKGATKKEGEKERKRPVVERLQHDGKFLV